MMYDDLEDLLFNHQEESSPSLYMSAYCAYSTYYAIWDSGESGQEFLLPKMPGINLQDLYGPLHKTEVMLKYLEEGKLSEKEKFRFDIILRNIGANVDNYWLFPLAPTRILVGISPFFKAFFPQQGNIYGRPYIPAFLPKEQFDEHFYYPERMELYEPCKTEDNMNYTFHVKELTDKEVWQKNALILNEEPEEFIFHDYNKIRDSFYAYERILEMRKKKHDYSKWI